MAAASLLRSYSTAFGASSSAILRSLAPIGVLVTQASSGRRPLIQQHTDGLAKVRQTCFALEHLESHEGIFGNDAPDFPSAVEELPFGHDLRNKPTYLELCSTMEQPLTILPISREESIAPEDAFLHLPLYEANSCSALPCLPSAKPLGALSQPTVWLESLLVQERN